MFDPLNPMLTTLSAGEEEMILNAGEDPADYIAAMNIFPHAPPMLAQIQLPNGTVADVLLFQIPFIIPPTLVAPPKGGILNSDGTPRIRTSDIVALPPSARVVLRRSALTEDARKAYEDAVNAHETRMQGAQSFFANLAAPPEKD